MSVRAIPWGDSCGPVIEGAQTEAQRLMMTTFLIDLDGQEDFYLEEFAKAEAGATITGLYNNHVDAQLYPDGRVILEELRYNAQDELDRGPPARIEITLAQAKQLILDWLAAKQSWYAQREPQVAGGSSGGREQA